MDTFFPLQVLRERCEIYLAAAAAAAAAAVHVASVSTRFWLLLLPLLMVIMLDTNGVRSTVILVRIQHNIVPRNR